MTQPRSRGMLQLRTSHDADQASKLAKDLQLSSQTVSQKFLAKTGRILSTVKTSSKLFEAVVSAGGIHEHDVLVKEWADAVREFVNDQEDDIRGLVRIYECFGLSAGTEEGELQVYDAREHELERSTVHEKESCPRASSSVIELASVESSNGSGETGCDTQSSTTTSSDDYFETASSSTAPLATNDDAGQSKPRLSDDTGKTGLVREEDNNEDHTTHEQAVASPSPPEANGIRNGLVAPIDLKGAPRPPPRSYVGTAFGNWQVVKATPPTSSWDGKDFVQHRGQPLSCRNERGHITELFPFKPICLKYCGIPYHKDFKRISDAHSKIYTRASIEEPERNCFQVTPAWRRELKESLGVTLPDGVTFVFADTAVPLPPSFVFRVEKATEIVVDDSPYWWALPEKSTAYELSYVEQTTKKTVSEGVNYIEGVDRFSIDDFEPRQKRVTTYSVWCRTNHCGHYFLDEIKQLSWQALGRECRGLATPKIKFSGSSQGILAALRNLDIEGRRSIKKLQLRFTVQEEAYKFYPLEPVRITVASSRDAWAQLFKFIRNSLQLEKLYLVVSEPLWVPNERVEDYESILNANPWLQDVASVKGLTTFHLKINGCWNQGAEGGLIAAVLERYLQTQTSSAKNIGSVEELVAVIRQRQSTREGLKCLFHRVAYSREFLESEIGEKIKAWTERPPHKLLAKHNEEENGPHRWYLPKGRWKRPVRFVKASETV